MTQDKENKRGGKRHGAGRKPADNKKIRISTSLAPDVVALLKADHQPIAQIIENAVRRWYGDKNNAN